MPRRKVSSDTSTSEIAIEQKVLTLPFPHSIEEKLRNALSWHEGYIPDDEEVANKAREIAYAAWEQYCASIEKEQERAIIL